MRAEARKNIGMLYKTNIVEEKISQRDLIRLGWAELQAMLSRGEKLALTIHCQSVFVF